MHTPFRVEILTPEGELFNGEVEMLSTRTSVGSIGILANHQPLLALLEPTELRLYRKSDDVVRFAQGEGYLQVSPEHVLVLVDEAFTTDQLDEAELRERLNRAEQELAEADAGSERASSARRAKHRYERFLELVRNS